jgi:CMP-N,N'-diacetyllegionaminic acid synthase
VPGEFRLKPHIIAIIPARGGSKAVPRKNIRFVAGKPLISYTINAALSATIPLKLITTTEDDELATVARSLGSDVLIRPPQLALDDTPMIPVLLHVLGTLAEMGQYFDFLFLLQPTAPLRSGKDIDDAFTELVSSGCDSIVSVYQVSDAHPARMYRLSDGFLVPYDAEPSNHLRQSLPPVFHRNGAIYACRTELLLKDNLLIGPKTRPYIMPRERSINIDDEIDLAFVDFLLKKDAGLD